MDDKTLEELGKKAASILKNDDWVKQETEGAVEKKIRRCNLLQEAIWAGLLQPPKEGIFMRGSKCPDCNNKLRPKIVDTMDEDVYIRYTHLTCSCDYEYVKRRIMN